MPLISIVITCFNSQETIERAVNSALSQNWDDKEIIVVDDNSTDSSFDILKEISCKNSQVKLFKHSLNQGYPSALNTAIRNSKGEFIAIFDDDDDNYKNRIYLQYKKIIEYENKYNQSLILCYSNREIYKKGEKKADHVAFAIGRKSPVPHGEEVAKFILGFPVNPSKVWGMFGSCTLMARKNVFLSIGSFDEYFRRTAEWDFAIRAAFKGSHFIAVNKPLIKMYKTSGLDKAGKIPLIYSLKLRDKYRNYLKSKRFYYSSRLIAQSNFYMNKKKNFLGIIFRFFALLISPIQFFRFLKIKSFKIFKFKNKI